MVYFRRFLLQTSNDGLQHGLTTQAYNTTTSSWFLHVLSPQAIVRPKDMGGGGYVGISSPYRTMQKKRMMKGRKNI